MKDKKIIKKIIIGLLIAIVLLGVYSVVVSPRDNIQSGSSLTSLLNNSVLGQVKETDIALANSEILRVLGSVQNINLNDDIFADPVFKLLKDSRFSIAKPTQIGRKNPFLPSGFDQIVAAQNQSLIPNDIVTDSGSFRNENSNFFNKSETESNPIATEEEISSESENTSS